MEPAGEPVVLFDTYSLLFRAHHALPPMNTKGGEPTSALYGFCSQLLKVLRELRPSRIAFAADAPKATFRHVRYAEYKAHREAAPSPLVLQLTRLNELLAALGVPVFRMPGYEADDLLATLARGLDAEGERALVVSGDRDLLQVVSANVNVLFIGARSQTPTLYDLAKVLERFGLAPAALPSFVALVGDASDNLPGVSGIGPRTASRLIREFGDVRSLLENLERVPSVKLRAALEAAAEQIRLNEELARLDANVPLSDGPRALPLDAEALNRVRELFEKLEFKSLLPRLAALSAPGRAPPQIETAPGFPRAVVRG